jgi:hypothetical protein
VRPVNRPTTARSSQIWIEKRGRQHRVYYRNPLPEKPKNRDNVVF